MKKIIIIIILLLSASSANAWNSEEVFQEFIRVPYDSFAVADYKVVMYHYQDSTGQGLGLENILKIFRDNIELVSVSDGMSELFNYCQALPFIKESCFLHDINLDGKDEIIVTYATGGGSCCEGAGYLFSMGDTATLLLEMPPANTSFQIRDYENDSIPEIITVDGTFQFFFDYNYRAFMEPLFWKWDGSKYRIANKQFADQILNALGPNQMPAMKDLAWVDSVQLSASRIIGAPSYQFLDMVFGYYAAGMPDKADSLFNQYWPPGVDGRDLYFKEIKNRVKNDPYYPKILDSDW